MHKQPKYSCEIFNFICPNHLTFTLKYVIIKKVSASEKEMYKIEQREKMLRDEAGGMNKAGNKFEV